MPNVRVMVWNIEHFSLNKVAVPNMTTALAAVVTQANVDVLIVLEVRKTDVDLVGQTFSAALNAAGGGNSWFGYFISEETGLEHYCIWIRDLDFIRPMTLDPGVAGTEVAPLRNLFQCRWRVWPSPDFAATAYPLLQVMPRFPLVDVFATPDAPLDREAKRRKTSFGGQPIGRGGYALGRGYRLPCMPILAIHTPTSDTYLPIVVCHYAAVRGQDERNVLAQGQVNQLCQLHICQLFNDGVASGWLQYLNAAGDMDFFPIQELMVTGDFNLDFLKNRVGLADSVSHWNRFAYDALTPTSQGGGSTGPAAAGPAPLGAMPAAPYAPPWGVPPSRAQIPYQRLHAAVTTQGTMLLPPPLAAPPAVTPPPSPYVSAAFDNFFYAGTRLNTAIVAHGVGDVDSGEVIDVPAALAQAGAPAPGGLDVAGIAAHYTARGTKSAATAPRLQAAFAAGTLLQENDRLVGARLLSDHLPVVIEFTVP